MLRPVLTGNYNGCSATDWQGRITIHSDGIDKDLYCVVYAPHAAKPTLELTAVSAACCESPSCIWPCAGRCWRSA